MANFHKFPTLYKKASTGAIQFWSISVFDREIRTEYGQVDTINPQQISDTINSGKNIGRANETTAEQQALLEAEAKWLKQKKRGYVESEEDAKAGNTDAVIEGGIFPMLAQKFRDHASKIEYPAYVQPKLDGIRCLAVVELDGDVTLWTRTRKPITAVPHIADHIRRLNLNPGTVLDGELYNHELKSDFEKIVSLVRKQRPVEGEDAKLIQYHVYDTTCDGEDPGMFAERLGGLSALAALVNQHSAEDAIKVVTTVRANDDSDVYTMFSTYREEGYEGAIVRNAKGLYVGKRSYDLQKVKEFDDGEFDIIGIKEGRGKLQGHVGAFMCVMPDGSEFEVKLSGRTDFLKECYENHAHWAGKKMTVRYQGLTKGGVCRFPTGVAIRDYE